MEIVHLVLGKANPERMNGVNKVVYQLAVAQAAAGRRVSVWGITRDPTPNFPPRPFGTRLFRAYRNKFKLDPALVKAVLDEGGDKVFHLHGGFNPGIAAAARLLAKRGRRFVFTPHGAYNLIAFRKSRWMKTLFFRLYERPMLRDAAAIHSLGKSEVDGLQQLFPNNKSMLIPYGFQAPAVPLSEAAPGPFVIGFCGRLDWYTKGLDLLLEAFARFAAAEPDATLWIIGDGQDKEQLTEMIAANGLRSRVKLWGSRFGTEKDDILRQCTVFAHPSRNEGLPTAVLEAAALGIPAIVTAATNTGEMISRYDAGIVIPKPDAQQLFEGLLRLRDRFAAEGRQGFSTRARRMIEQGYNWSSIVAEFDKLYSAG